MTIVVNFRNPLMTSSSVLLIAAEQLYLQISFVDCKSLRKAIITLDMACLTQ